MLMRPVFRSCPPKEVQTPHGNRAASTVPQGRRTRQFTRAAEDLRITQPALSRAVAKLEEELGQPVFERQTRKLSLTVAGQLLVARAQQIVSLIEDTKAEITDDGRTGRLRIAAIPTIAPYFLPHNCRRSGECFPMLI